MASFIAFFAGGRKWRGFLVLVALVMALVVGGWVTDQNIIRDLVLGLFAVLGAATAAEKFSGKKPSSDEQMKAFVAQAEGYQNYLRAEAQKASVYATLAAMQASNSIKPEGQA